MYQSLERPCLECNKPLNRPGKGDFCTPKCKAAFHNRRAKRGALLYDAMILGRHIDKKKHPDWHERIALLLTQWEEEDRKAGHKRTTRAAFDVTYDLPRTDVIVEFIGSKTQDIA